MAATPISTTNAAPVKRWWLSLYPRLSTQGKRGLMVVCLGAALFAQSIGLLDSSTRDPSTYYNPAVQNDLHQSALFVPDDPIGDQFQINSYTSSYQHWPQVAMDGDGDFVVIWVSDGSNGSDTDHYSIQGQRYNSAGVPQGSQFQVNSYTNDIQRDSAVSMDSDGDFVVVWGSQGSSGTDTEGYSIQGQRYNSAGVPQGSQFQVNTYTTNNQFAPSVALDGDGDFVVAWASDGSSDDTSSTSIQAQRYDSNGTPQGSQFQVNSYTTDSQTGVAVSADSDGDFVVVWSSEGSFGNDTNGRSIQAQRYDSNGTPQGSQFQVNSYTTSQQTGPTVALDADGDFVVVWQSDGSSGGDTAEYSVQGQRYNSAGVPQGSQFQVNSYTTSNQRFPHVALDSDGDFIIIWQSDGGIGTDFNGYSIQGMGYNSAGAPQGSQFQVNSYTTNYQAFPSVALDSDGDFVVAWTSNGSDGTDTSYFSIQGQRFTPSGFIQTPAPTPTATNTPNPSVTPTPSATPSATHTPTPTATQPPLKHSLYLPAVIH